MRTFGRQFALAVTCAVLLAGCAIAHGPIIAPLALDVQGPVSAGSAAGSSKVGRASAIGIVMFATGDASISTAMRNGGITRIHHVDHETSNYFGIYSKYTTVVYGE